ncbi:hypothetical protein L3Q82_010445 [Scortum barcoo]|uniref:Uncharacterized protein n=1 Tax=Scortum barcoo TaxID=214431 RepID=A0ACB8WBF7_9TELE|nr:hypothetical protein L3Q82_010445 [Scortum barcoo]
MRKLVDAVQNLPSPSTPHTSKPELELPPLPPPLAEPDGVEEDDWPAPPPWPDPAMETLLPDKPPQVKEEVVPTPITQPFESQPPGQQSAYDTSHYLRPWLKLVQPLPQPCTLPPPEFGYHTGYSAPKSEPGCNPQQLPSRSWMQPPPSGLFPGRNSSVTESGYYGPRPSIRNFSRRDPSEFARLKLSLENLLPPEATELFKYQVLVDHLQLEEAQLIADAYLNSPTPFSDTMAALNDRFGQPHQIALRRIAAVMDAPDIRRGDIAAFEKFALQVQSLVGMLKTLGSEGEAELKCGSHVARLLSKLPPEQRAEFRRCMFHQGTQTHTLPDLSEWLKYESWCQDSEGQLALRGPREKPAPRPEGRQSNRPITVLHGGKDADEMPEVRALGSSFKGSKSKPFCPFCNNGEHYLSQCPVVSRLTKDQLTEWIKSNKRCWRCARSHQAAQCNLRKTCSLCQGKHLQVLHEVNASARPVRASTTKQEVGQATRATTEVLYLDRPTSRLSSPAESRQSLHPLCRRPGSGLQVHSPQHALNWLAIPTQLNSSGRSTTHLIGIPIQTLMNVKPMLLIGSDHPHLITPTDPVRLGPPGGPAAIRTRLGWTLQGPSSVVSHFAQSQQCLLTTVAPQVSELMKHVERLWQVDIVPFRSEKLVTRSRQDQEAISILELKTN